MQPASFRVALLGLGLFLAAPAGRGVASLARQEPAAEGRVELQDGAAAKAVAGVGPETRPVALGELLAAEREWLFAPRSLSPGPRARAASWEAWGRWLAAAREGGPDAAARTGIVLVALREERWEDAWLALGALGGQPAEVAALLPHFLPGAPLGHPAAAGGLPSPLADGVVLAPAVPPAPPGEPPGTLRTRRASVQGVRIGEARVAVDVLLEPAGVQVDLRHLSGGPARFAVLLPEVEGQEVRVEYVDWMRQDTRREPLAVELLPGSEPVVLFGRFLPRDPLLPASPASELPRTLSEGGIWIEVAAGQEELDLPRVAAEALGRALGVPSGLRRPLDPPPAGPFAGIVLHYAGAEQGAELLDRVASAAEAWLRR